MLKRLIDKILSVFVLIRHSKMSADLRYFCRDTYYCQLVQLKYVLRDFVIKKKYKTVSFDGEFAPELQFALPFAYWHYKNGTLKETKTCKNMAEFYFFSPSHTEVFDTRTNEGNYNFEMPRILYSHNYKMRKWLPVPLKEVYKNQVYVFEKPTVIVANRYNMEWDGPPISFFSIDMLQFIFDSLKDNYTIIYNRPGAQHITMDNSEIYELNEIDWIRTNYPEVVLMQDLFRENKGNARNFNHLQLMVYANSDNFLSIHGGTSVLASYFKGTNIIFSKQGPEHVFLCYQNLYPRLSGARIFHAKSEKELKSLVLKTFSTEAVSTGLAS